MPVYTISAVGGQFLSASTWVGGVVPPSATDSDILGLTSSGPLTLSGSFGRNIGSWIFQDYKNIITYTANGNFSVFGSTFSLNSGMTFSLSGAASGGASCRFNIASNLAGITQSIIWNGCNSFRSGLYFQGNRPVIIRDEVLLNERSFLQLGNANTTQIQSLTASIPAKITFDLENGGNAGIGAALQSTINLALPVYVDVYFKNTFGSTNSVVLNQQATNVGFGSGTKIIIDGGNLVSNSTFPLTLLVNGSFEYISGTFSGDHIGLVLNLTRQSATHLTGTSSIKSNGISWDYITIYNRLINNSYVKFDNDLQTKNFIINQTVWPPTPIHLDATNVNFNVSENMLLSANYPVSGNSGVYQYPATQVQFQSGGTYSIRTLLSNQVFINLPDVNSTYNYIVGTGGTAKLDIASSSVVYGTQITNINAITQPIYCLDGIVSSSTNVLTSLPTGGTGGGTASAEYSFAYIS